MRDILEYCECNPCIVAFMDQDLLVHLIKRGHGEDLKQIIDDNPEQKHFLRERIDEIIGVPGSLKGLSRSELKEIQTCWALLGEYPFDEIDGYTGPLTRKALAGHESVTITAEPHTPRQDNGHQAVKPRDRFDDACAGGMNRDQVAREKIRDLIRHAEHRDADADSGACYDMGFGSKLPVVNGVEKPLTEMTINEVMAWQETQKYSAAGAYQIINKTMKMLVKMMGLTGEEKFDQEMQDRMADRLMDIRGYKKYMAGELPLDDFMKNLSCEWASLPDPYKGGRSHYDGDGVNSVQVSEQDTIAAIVSARDTMLSDENPDQGEYVAQSLSADHEEVFAVASVTDVMKYFSTKAISDVQAVYSAFNVDESDKVALSQSELNMGELIDNVRTFLDAQSDDQVTTMSFALSSLHSKSGDIDLFVYKQDDQDFRSLTDVLDDGWDFVQHVNDDVYYDLNAKINETELPSDDLLNSKTLEGPKQVSPGNRN